MHVLIVDDHPLFRQGLRALLSALDPGLETTDVSAVPDVRALHAAGYRPELVLLDMNLPGVSKMDALRDVKALFDEASVVVVSADEDPTLIRSAIDAGAAGYIPKTTDATITIQALRLVLSDGIYLPSIALDALPEAPVRVVPPAGSEPGEFSPRQRAVLRCLLQGKANKVIARELDMAEGTVKAHLWAVYQALGVNSRTQAMYRAHELGIFTHPSS
ncbi:DNA-binding NarL/FixJ family response regulator [Variovorax boronicumulans]|uniref:response regulator n=1 Tax=Variovorax boronicumulans TaxID=436515 RepID=UPI00278AEEE5|nr:response regulator [Variovorax boronicumulans]MDQ0036690.1 DNA-binding NarL/FixJ family response regulator [Variovorax boronicumulans]